VAAQGIVFVVGAGPDLPGLLTVRGRELLSTADAGVYDRRAQRKLIPGGVAGGPERYYVGSRSKGGRPASADIAQLLVTLARQEKRVVYLVHGDPLALGNGSELVTALHDASVEFEIIPGVPVGNAVATYSGIPLLSPTMTSTTIFASGRSAARGGADADWSAIAKAGATVVISEATAVLPAVVTGFAVAGIPGEIPAAAIVHAGRASQRVIIATLGTISDEIARAGLLRSVTVVIGWTVLLRDELAWFDNRPLFGVRIVFARSRYGSRAVADRLGELGAAIVDVPMPRITRLDLTQLRDELERIAAYEWLVFASPDAVTIFWEHLILGGGDTRALSNAKVACVEPATAAALLDRGVTVDVVQDRFDPVALTDALSERSDIPGASMLYLADDATAEPFGRDLEQTGATVTSLPLYREVPNEKTYARLRRVLGEHHASLVVAMSPAAADEYVRAAGEHVISSVPAAAYDEATAQVLRDAGIDVTIIPATPGVDTIVEAIRSKFGSTRHDTLS
jgi:uroporphyrinogen III methyltransferase / synthase